MSIKAYQLRSGGARERLAILRRMARDSLNNPNPATRLFPDNWQGARHYKLNNYESVFCMLDQGFDAGAPVWYAHTGEQFRGELDSGDIVNMRHRGWFTDIHGEELAIGIVGRLTHGRFISGYRWTANNERVYFPAVFDNADDAARMGDEHARVFAENAREDSERFDAMTQAECHAEFVADDVNMAFQARNVSARHREYCKERIEELRAARNDVAEKTAEYNRG